MTAPKIQDIVYCLQQALSYYENGECFNWSDEAKAIITHLTGERPDKSWFAPSCTCKRSKTLRGPDTNPQCKLHGLEPNCTCDRVQVGDSTYISYNADCPAHKLAGAE